MRLDDKVENHFLIPDKFLKKTLGKPLQLAQCTFRLCFLGPGFMCKKIPDNYNVEVAEGLRGKMRKEGRKKVPFTNFLL